MTSKNQLLVSSIEDLEKKYNFILKKKHGMIMDKSKIPQTCWALIPYVEFFYSKDQKERESLSRKIPKKAVHEFKQIVELYDAKLDEWLGGAEANSHEFSDEYIAFSLFRIKYL